MCGVFLSFLFMLSNFYLSSNFSAVMRCFNNLSPPNSPLFFDVPHVSRNNSTNSANRSEDDTTSLCSVADDPIHILNVALTTDKGVDDVTLNTMFQNFVDSNKVGKYLIVERDIILSIRIIVANTDITLSF